MTSKKLYSLQFETNLSDFETNLDKLVSLIDNCEDGSIILAPEVCITGFCYSDMDSASNFADKVIQKLKELSTTKTITTTIIEKIDNKYYNTLYTFHKNSIIHKQSKNRLFALGDETKYFDAGDEESIKIVDVDGIKIANLICFELRFITLWEKLKGADIIQVPAMWGKPRAEHYETLTKALAIANQCFVIASDSANFDMGKNSGIISPFGNVTLDNDKEIIFSNVDLDEIKKMRRYLDISKRVE
jgi:predicted amidohydrolase